MVQVVWRGQRRRMELDGPWTWRQRQRDAVTQAQEAAQDSGQESVGKASGYLPMEGNFRTKMRRYRAVKIAEKEGLSLEDALARVTAAASAQAAGTTRQGHPKKLARTNSTAAMRHLAKKFGGSKGKTVKGGKQMKSKKKKSKSYPFFLFLRGGAPGLGRRK